MTAATATAIDTQRRSTDAETEIGPYRTATIRLLYENERWVAHFTEKEGDRMTVDTEGNVEIHWNEADAIAQLVLEMEQEEWHFDAFLLGWDREAPLPVDVMGPPAGSTACISPDARRLVVDLTNPGCDPDDPACETAFAYIFEPARTAASADAAPSEGRIFIDPKITNKGDG